MISTKVQTVEIVAENVYFLKLNKPFYFKPGQLINIGVDNYPPRVYSICSGINENFLGILFDEKPMGKVTPVLKKLNKGDNIAISEPFGNFTADGSPAYWIATGTGIAPFYSMVKSGISKNKLLIHGGRTIQSFYFQDEFLEIFEKNYTRCCSSQCMEGYFNGRLTDYLKQQKDLPVNYKYYLCGSAEMVVNVRDILISKGIPYGQIIAEIYF